MSYDDLSMRDTLQNFNEKVEPYRPKEDDLVDSAFMDGQERINAFTDMWRLNSFLNTEEYKKTFSIMNTTLEQ
eukprot:3078495-Prymnesium_polylepis.2